MRIMTDHAMPENERRLFADMYGDYHGKALPGDKAESKVTKLFKFFYPYYEYENKHIGYGKAHSTKKDYQSADYSNHYHYD